MGFSSLWEGGLQAGCVCIWAGAEGRLKGCFARRGGCCSCAPSQGKRGTAVGELMWIAKIVTVLKFGGGEGVHGGSHVHTRGAPPKVTKNGSKLCCHLDRDWAGLVCFLWMVW